MNKEPNNLLPSLQEFLDSLDEHVWLKDLNGVYVLCNKAVEQAWNKKSHILLVARMSNFLALNLLRNSSKQINVFITIVFKRLTAAEA